MNKILKRTTNTISIASFWESWLLQKYNLDPVYQRKSVWSDEKQSFFIDSLLRNFPIPPIFLHQHIDIDSGKTVYDVIDGKQRLTALSRFIQNEIPCSTETDEDEESSLIAGCYFTELDASELREYKQHFWRYELPIEYIDTEENSLIDAIFDRLNRNGEPLEGQELRNARYHNSYLLGLVQKKVAQEFWDERLSHVDKARMEDLEFLSELFFVLLQNALLSADQRVLDELYETYTIVEVDWDKIEALFDGVTNFMSGLDLEYEDLKISGVSHLYGLWTFSWYCHTRLDVSQVADRIQEFYRILRARDTTVDEVNRYRESMSSRTKNRSQRIKRLRALGGFCGLEIEPV